jgi:hypothetical protein
MVSNVKRSFSYVSQAEYRAYTGRIPRLRRGTGLSACIFFTCGKKVYHFNPLRISVVAHFPKKLKIQPAGIRAVSPPTGHGPLRPRPVFTRKAECRFGFPCDTGRRS